MQYQAFTLVDSYGITYYPLSAVLGEDGHSVTLTFLDFNNAFESCEATLAKLLKFADDNGLALNTQKAKGGHGDFDLYGDTERTQNPYETSDNYIAYCISNGMLPMFYEFADMQDYYKNLYDFNVFDRTTYNPETGLHEDTAERKAYAPQTPIRFELPEDFFKLCDKYFADYDNQRKAFAEKKEAILDDVVQIKDSSKKPMIRVAKNGKTVKGADVDEALGRKQLALREVDPVEPTTQGWKRTATTSEAMKAFPNLWNVAAEESEKRNPTQIASTVGTYRKIYDILKKEGFNGTILDASSGLGIGTEAGRNEYGFKVDDIEPYPDSSYSPKYTDYSKLHKKYDVIISSAVLNVLPQDQRDALVVKMGQLLNEGGRMFITTRGKDVENLAKTGKNIHLGDMEWIETVKGSYQKGFTNPELILYLRDALGEGFTVVPASKETGGKFNNNTNVVVYKDSSKKQYALRDNTRPLNETEKKAIDVFGTTENFAEAGYILANGEMLNFAGKAKNGERDYDHRAIAIAYGKDIDLTKNHGFDMDATPYLERFVEEGAIRLDTGSLDLNMDMGIQLSSKVPLTVNQEQTIRELIKWKNEQEEMYKPSDEYDGWSLYSEPLALRVEFGGDGDYAVGSVSKRDLDAWGIPSLHYEGGKISPYKVIADIRHYYETGEVRQQSVTSQFHSQYALRADPEIEEKNINNGSTALNRLIESSKTSDNPEELVEKNAMYRSDIGYIDFKWGTPGTGSKFKRGFGFAHIIAKRNAEGRNGIETAYKVVEVIAKATDGDVQNNEHSGEGHERLRLHYDGYTVILSKEPADNSWVLTGWENEKEVKAYATGEVYDSSNATAAMPTLTRHDGGDAFTSNGMVTQNSAESQAQYHLCESNLGYHAGDLGKAEYLKQQSYSRGTGHFGTGTYFVGEEAKVTKDSYYGKRPQHAVDFSNYKLYKVRNDRQGYRLHDALRVIDGGINADWILPASNMEYSAIDSTEYYKIAKEISPERYYEDSVKLEALKKVAEKYGLEIPSKETYAKEDVYYEPEDEFFESGYVGFVKKKIDEQIKAVNKEYAKFRKTVLRQPTAFHPVQRG